VLKEKLLIECKSYFQIIEKIGSKLSQAANGLSLWDAYQQEFNKVKEKELDIESNLIVNFSKEFWKCEFCNFDENISNNDICSYCYLNRFSCAHVLLDAKGCA